ncbi:similar to Saccharomyces cerevisiae YBR104W YMC2 Mitochondrial protein, putative inner membrane transporter with a role in oleate metabolism and glutamate biosynthesis [Maudiozyma saulgeensis]|uniref:Similar to Saccharomyces cerevisiae YBR104W YMC2 Mitochondrial protein, putative inner membrane transporter with a role in oleate metabolism and glutamate biosynthesis n=1 Tax=Maudiozyma saulgeensis TaxID=1789683 RepID=A0A1X7R3W2_9SACH|nr:similar to Saccharomyces cerevisiae YBR104W YMC2 Mitochondrial protein, putative inner membrane transporter with a role in oleate metabolism and glutamate biosynthesis [Kazachstania saulgeensis]
MSEEFPTPQLIDDLDIQPVKDNTRVFKDLLAGTAGGVAQVLVGQPFDTTKVRLQTATTRTSAVEVVKSLLKNEGPRGFYKGTLTPLVGVGACVSIQFGVNEAMKRFFHSMNKNPNNSTLSLPQYYMCGVAGGFSNSFLAAPIEHVRIRLQTQTSSGPNAEFKGPLDCIRKLRAQNGLMRGFNATLLREGHGCGTYFLVYEALVANEINKGFKRTEVPTWKLCMFGALSGTTLWIMVYPLDVIKSVMQTDNLKQPKYGKSVISVGKQLYAKHGMSAFLKGFGPTIIRAAPANGATFATFEIMMRMLG